MYIRFSVHLTITYSYRSLTQIYSGLHSLVSYSNPEPQTFLHRHNNILTLKDSRQQIVRSPSIASRMQIPNTNCFPPQFPPPVDAPIFFRSCIREASARVDKMKSFQKMESRRSLESIDQFLVTDRWREIPRYSCRDGIFVKVTSR